MTGFGPGVERLPFSVQDPREDDGSVDAFDNTFSNYTASTEAEVAKWAASVTLTTGQARQSIALYRLPGELGNENPDAWFGFQGRGQQFDAVEGDILEILGA